MSNLKNFLKQPLLPVPTSLVVAILFVAIIGFADASYLTIEHYQGNIPPCSLTNGCEKVLTSSYSVILGVPVSLAGSIFYLAVAVGAFAYLEGKRERIFFYTQILTMFGLLFSLWFIYVQAFILQAYCLYCLFSAVTSIALFVLARTVFSKYSPTARLPQ